MKTTSKRFSSFAVLMILLTGMAASGETASRSLLTVSSLADSGVGTLREALTNAQNGDTILFDPTLANGTIVLTQDLPTVSLRLTVDGEDHNITIDGASNKRSGLTLDDGADVVVRNLAFDNGFSGDGGAFFAEGSFPASVYLVRLVIQHCSFANNRAFKAAPNAPRYGGAVFGKKVAVVIEDSTFTDNRAEEEPGGGGLYGAVGGAVALQGGSLRVERSSFLNSSARAGGAIWVNSFNGVEQEVTIIDSTFRLNTANGEHLSVGGGAVSIAGSSAPALIRNCFFGENQTAGQGGALSGGSELRVENSTFYYNEVTNPSGRGGAIYAWGASLSQITVAYNSTAGPNGGGVHLISSSNFIENSVLANNTAGGLQDDCSTGSTSSASVRNSLVKHNSTVDPCTLVAGTGNITINDPRLNPPADNGGHTRTMSLQGNSPVLDQADAASCLAADQRGLLRLGGACDMGAYESNTTVRCAAFNGIHEFVSPNQSAIQSAIDDLSGTNPLIKIAGTCVGAASTAGSTQSIYIDEPVRLEGGHHPLDWSASPDPKRNETVIDAAGTGRVIRIVETGDVRISNLTLRNGVTTGNGGGILLESAGALMLQQTTIRDNSANSGAGIYLAGGAAILIESTLSNNVASNRGGGLYILGADADIVRTTFSGNSALVGGGLINIVGIASVQNSTFSGNRSYRGAGIRNDQNGTMTVNHATIAGNNGTTSDSVGIGIDNVGEMTLSNSIVADSSVGPDCDDLSSGLMTVRNTFVADESCITNNVDGNLSGDPQLEILWDNGGTTRTHAFDAASEVLGGGGAGDCLAIDQRRFARAGVTCDLGSLELLAETVDVLIFADRFESGGTAAWSSTFP